MMIEYVVIGAGDPNSLSRALNEQAKQGYKLVSIVPMTGQMQGLQGPTVVTVLIATMEKQGDSVLQ